MEILIRTIKDTIAKAHTPLLCILRAITRGCCLTWSRLVFLLAITFITWHYVYMYRRAFINLSYSENAYCLLDTKCYNLAHLHYTFPFSSLSPMSHHYIISAALFKCNFISLFIDWFLAALGLCCCVGFSLVAESLDDSLAVICGLLVGVASLVAAPRF